MFFKNIKVIKLEISALHGPFKKQVLTIKCSKHALRAYTAVQDKQNAIRDKQSYRR